MLSEYKKLIGVFIVSIASMYVYDKYIKPKK